MINAIEKNLERGIHLLNTISDEQYSNTSIAPYHSSIGGHIRHVLDVFSCVFDGLESKNVDFSARERNELVEHFTAKGILYFNKIKTQLNELKGADFDMMLSVSDDLGLGKVTVKYTLGSALIQAHSHAIHHFSSIGFIIDRLGIELPDEDFGYNPTTPKRAVLS